MKVRLLMLMVTMMLTAVTTSAQGVRAQAQTERVVNLENVRGLEPLQMRPDTVMPNGEWQRVVQTEMTAREGYKYARQVLARVVPDYQQSVQLEDTADCKLVVTARLPLIASAESPRAKFVFMGSYGVTLTLVMKDGRYRVSCEAVRCTFDVRTMGQVVDRKQDMLFQDANRLADGAMQFDLRMKAGKLVALIDSMLKKQKSDNDF